MLGWDSLGGAVFADAPEVHLHVGDGEATPVAGGEAQVTDVDEHVSDPAAHGADEMVVGVLDVRVDAHAAGTEVDDSSTSRIASRSWTVWYTVFREIVGIVARAR